MTKEKVAVLIPHFGRGGAEIFAIEMTMRLGTHFEMIIFCSDRAENDYDTSSLVVKYIGSNLYDPETLCNILKKESIKLIWSHMSWDNYHVKCLPLFKQQGFKVILTEHSSFWYPYFCEGIGIWNNADQLKITAMSTFSMLDAVICVSKDSYLVYDKFIPNAYYIPNYPNTLYTNNKKVLKDIDSGDMAVGNVSSFLKPVKRMDLLYKAFDASLSYSANTKLHIAGRINWLNDFTYRKQCKYLKRNSIILHGEISDVKSFYESIDVFCLTSQLEGMPTVVLEASTMSIPVVSFDIPGIEELISDGTTGYIVKFPDFKEMGRILSELSKNKSQLEKMGDNAKRLVDDKFSAESSARQYTDLINKILNKVDNNYASASIVPFWELSAIENSRNAFADKFDKNNILNIKPNVLTADWNFTPLVSFLIPCYNCKETIHRVLNSLYINYSFEWEIVILDDGSCDGGLDNIPADFLTKRKVRLINHEKNKGLYEARSTLAKSARGHFIVFVDADDTISNEIIEIFIKYAIATDADVIDGGLNEVQDGKPNFHYSPKTSFLTKSLVLNKVEARTSFFSNKIKHSCCGKVYKRDKFLKSIETHLPYENINTCEDMVRNSLIFSHGVTYTAISSLPFYNYIRCSQSMSKHAPSLSNVLNKIFSLSTLYRWTVNNLKAKITGYESECLIARLYGDSIWIVQQYLEQTYYANRVDSQQTLNSVIKEVIAICNKNYENEDKNLHRILSKTEFVSKLPLMIILKNESINNANERLKKIFKKLLHLIIAEEDPVIEKIISKLDHFADLQFERIFKDNGQAD